MHTLDTRIRKLLGTIPQSYWEEKISSKPGYWGERILSQLVFARETSKIHEDKYDPILLPAITFLEEALYSEGAITKQAALKAESMLSEFSPVAKDYTILCVAHAHIDMNWKWPWNETVAVVLDTFRTMLNLMEEYPEFHFSQSQGAIYQIVEKYVPSMIAEIKERIKQGKWEVTASHWVEADKNMPNGESLARQMLYSKSYLSKLLDLEIDQMLLDFEPDTFGHNAQVPEILSKGGIKYYYHCRGSEGPILYRWESQSGKSVIAYREPTWYNDYVQPILASYVPEICRQTGLKTRLYVYGVGDHGGGPTKRDLERLRDMQQWPIYPNIRFGTFSEFYKLAEEIVEDLPLVSKEQNFVFTGCYTSQSRIKKANRFGEAALNEAEAFSALAAAAEGMDYPAEAYAQGWRNVLFNQFHDILPGSGILETREHALGLFQETMAVANIHRKLAIERIAASIHTLDLNAAEDKLSISAGAGAGFGSGEFRASQVERGSGSTRIVHIFNSSIYERDEAVQIILWDWKSQDRTLIVKNSQDQVVEHQWLDQGFNHYWGHDYLRILIQTKVPALGYGTYTISEGELGISPYYPTEPRLEKEKQFVLENGQIRVEFDPLTACVVSLLHKKTGVEMVNPSLPAGVFRLIQENADEEMSAWYVGEYMEIQNLHHRVKWKTAAGGRVRQSLQYELEFNRSLLRITVSLDHKEARLDYEVECDWQEAGKRGSSVPQLNFHWPLAYACESYQYDIPFGTVERKPMRLDVPANSWGYALREDINHPGIQLVTDSKYGFRGIDNALSVSLIRSSFDPDPYPELGNHHKFKLGISVEQMAHNYQKIEAAYRFNHPLTVLSGTSHAGTRQLEGNFIQLVEGAAVLAGLKVPEQSEGNQWIIRLYEAEGQSARIKLQLFLPIESACYVDFLERPLSEGGRIAIMDKTIEFEVGAHCVASILLTLNTNK